MKESLARTLELGSAEKRSVHHAAARHGALFDEVVQGALHGRGVVCEEVGGSVRGAIRRRCHLADPRERTV